MDLDTLLLPLTDAAPCGADLLHESEFDEIGAARREDDPSESRGIWTAAPKRADWQGVARLCTGVLGQRSKDLQVCAWLGEAWIALDGLDGGARAALLMTRMCERFWPGVHPLPRGADYDFRTAPLAWADRYWSRALLLRVPLLGVPGQDARQYTLAQWNDALALENDELKRKDSRKDARKGQEQAGAVTHARLLDAAATMPLALLRATLDGVHAWRAALEALNATLEPLVPPPGTRLTRHESSLADAANVLQQCLPLHPDYVAPVADAALAIDMLSAAQEFVPVAAAARSPDNRIAGRAEAYRQLQQIAAYLASIEPHSPVPSLIRRAIDWGDMPFEKLMGELMENNGELQKILWRAPR